MSKESGQLDKPKMDNPQKNEGKFHDASEAEDWTTPVERAAETAKEQAGHAADALRRGEFMQDAMVDLDANSDDRLIGLLCYATQIVIPLVMPIIVLLSESSKKRPFQRYHAMQSLALSILFMVLSIVAVVGIVVVQIIPIIGTLIIIAALCLSPIAYIMTITAFIYYGYQAYKGKRFSIPGLTSFLHDQEWL